MHARVIFCRVSGLLETLKVVYILSKGKKSINAEKNENVELLHTQVFPPASFTFIYLFIYLFFVLLCELTRPLSLAGHE